MCICNIVNDISMYTSCVICNIVNDISMYTSCVICNLLMVFFFVYIMCYVLCVA